MSFVRGYMAAMLVFSMGNAVVFAYLAYALIVLKEANPLVAGLKHSGMQPLDFALFAVGFASVVIGLAVWLMDAVDQRLRWRRRWQKPTSFRR